MPTYYFDSVGGSDSNNGLSPSAPLRGVSPAITTYMVSGNTLRFKRGSIFGDGTGMTSLDVTSVQGLTMEDYGDGELPWFDARRPIASASWVYTGSNNIWYRQRAFTRQVQRVFAGASNIELLESSHKNGGISGINGAQTFWYWVLDDPSLGSDRLYMWSGSSTLTPTQVWGSVMISDLSTAYATQAMRFTTCSDIVLRNLRVSGVIERAINLRGGNNFLLDGVVLDFAPQRAPSLFIEAFGTSDANNIEIKNCKFLNSGVYRNWYSTSGASDNNDPNCDPAKQAPFRTNDGNDTIRFACPSNITIRNSLIEAGYHGGLMFYPQNLTGRAGDINLEMTGSTIVCGTMGPYSRAFALQRSALGGAGAVVLVGNTITGQGVRSQIAGCGSALIKNNVFGPCNAPLTSLPDYYNTGLVNQIPNSTQQLSFQSYSGMNAFGGVNSIIVEDNQFQGSSSAPIAGEFYDGEAAAGTINIRNNHFANLSDPWRFGSAPRLVERRTAGAWVPVFANNTYEGNYNAVVGLWTGASFNDTSINAYGGGNVQQAKVPLRPVITPRV